jgi:hypothetical protein
VTLSIPDFVRGPGQSVNLPADETGIPITISEGTNVRAVDLRIAYDPALLTITGATVGADTPAGATVIVNTNTPGLAILVFFSSNALPAGSGTFINLEASVPASSGIYNSQQVLDLHAATVSDGNDNEAPVVVDDAFQLTSYFADVSGNGRVNASDAAQVARFAALIDGGFAASLNADPIIVGDPSGNGRVNAADASLVAQFAALIDVPQIPAVPGGIALSGISPGPNDSQGVIAAPNELGTAVLGDSSTPGGGLDESGETSFQVVDDFLSADGGNDMVDAVDRMMTELASNTDGVDADQSDSLLEEAIDELLSSM